MAGLIKSERTEDKCDQMVGIPSPAAEFTFKEFFCAVASTPSRVCSHVASQQADVREGTQKKGSHPPPQCGSFRGKPVLQLLAS